MGYKIVYSKPTRQKKSRKRIILFVSLFFLLFAVCTRISYPEAAGFLWNVLVSEQWTMEMEAFLEMITEGERGEGVTDAVQVFCQEIFGGA